MLKVPAIVMLVMCNLPWSQSQDNYIPPRDAYKWGENPKTTTDITKGTAVTKKTTQAGTTEITRPTKPLPPLQPSFEDDWTLFGDDHTNVCTEELCSASDKVKQKICARRFYSLPWFTFESNCELKLQGCKDGTEYYVLYYAPCRIVEYPRFPLESFVPKSTSPREVKTYTNTNTSSTKQFFFKR